MREFKIGNSKFFCSWSGGKDSCLALYRAIKGGGIPEVLLTMIREDGEKSRSHGLPISLLEQQAKSIDIPIITYATTWDNYENIFISAIREIKKNDISIGVFGDIDIDQHIEWVERVCSSVEVISFEPLWKENRKDLLSEFLDNGFKARIVAVKDSKLNKSFIGRELDKNLIEEFELIGIDASGEEGEYHTVVIDGPIFNQPIKIDFGEPVFKDGYWFADIS